MKNFPYVILIVAILGIINYEQTSFKGGAPAGEDRKKEDLFLSRFQVSF